MRIQHLVNLSHHNTFGFPVIAEECTTVESEEDALKLHSTGFFSLPHRILGGGSNVLFTTNAIPKVLINRIEGINILEESDESIRIQFGAGMTWHTVVEHAVNNGWGGIENLSLIPGSIGAAPIQNIGAYGVELKDTFHSLTRRTWLWHDIEVVYPIQIGWDLDRARHQMLDILWALLF